MKKSINGVIVDLTAEEIAKREIEVAKFNEERKEYSLNRQSEYPSIGDQLDMLWHAVDTGDWTAAKVKTTEFYTALKAVKVANPK